MTVRRRTLAWIVAGAVLAGCSPRPPPQQDVVDITEQVRIQIKRLVGLATDSLATTTADLTLTEQQSAIPGESWFNCDDQLHEATEMPDRVTWSSRRNWFWAIRPRVDDDAVAAFLRQSEGWTVLRELDNDFRRIVRTGNSGGYTVSISAVDDAVAGTASSTVEAISARVAAPDDLHTRAPQRL